MNETDLRRELERASANLHPHADPQGIWTAGVRARRRRQVTVIAGSAVAAAAITITGVAMQAIDSATPDPRPETTPSPPNESTGDSVPYLTEDQVQPVFYPADLDSVPWDDDIAVRSWDPVDPVPLAENPVDHAAVVVQSAYDEPDAISVLGDDGQWRSLDLTGIELSDSYEYDDGVTRGSLSPDGTQLALGQPDGVLVVDLTTDERTTYDVPDLGASWQGREVFWSPDATRVYVDSWSAKPGRVVDLASGETQAVPFDPMSAAFLDDGRVVEDYFSMRTLTEIRIYDAEGNRIFRARNSADVLDVFEYMAGRGDRWAAQRIDSGWTPQDPRASNALASGVLVMGPDVQPEAFLPVKRYGLNGGGGAIVGWRGDDTVLFRIWLSNQHLAVLAWQVDSGEITRIADYHSSMRDVSVAADYLPVP